MHWKLNPRPLHWPKPPGDFVSAFLFSFYLVGTCLQDMMAVFLLGSWFVHTAHLGPFHVLFLPSFLLLPVPFSSTEEPPPCFLLSISVLLLIYPHLVLHLLPQHPRCSPQGAAQLRCTHLLPQLHCEFTQSPLSTPTVLLWLRQSVVPVSRWNTRVRTLNALFFY